MPPNQPQNGDQDINKIAEDLSTEVAQSMFMNTFQAFSKMFNITRQREEVLLKKIENLQAENISFQNENAILKERYSEVNKRLTDIMSELAKYNRIEEGETNLDFVILADKFRQLRNQDFENVVKKILKYVRIFGAYEVQQDDGRGNREKARIRALIARHILLEDDATDNTAIIENIRAKLGISEYFTEWLEIREGLQKLVEKSRQLVTEIKSTDPPGKLVGDSFDSDQHEVPPGFEATGRVS